MLKLKSTVSPFTFNTGVHHFIVDQSSSQEQIEIVSKHPDFKDLFVKTKSEVIKTPKDDKEASN